MTQSVDNNPPGQPKHRESKGKNKEPPDSEKPNDPSKAAPQSRSSYRQRTGSDNMQYYPGPPTYMPQPGNYGPPQSALSMANMASVLPNYQSSPTRYEQPSMQQHHFVAATPAPGSMYGLHPFQPYPAAPTNANMMFSPLLRAQMYVPFVHHEDARYGHLSPAAHGALGGPMPGPVGGYGQNYYNQTVYAATPGYHSRPSSNMSSSAFMQRRSQQHDSTPKASEDLEKETQRRLLNLDYDVSKTIVDGSTHMRPAAAPGQSDSTPTPSNPAKSATPRGPPRKPKQSGHALWVGNLAPGTSIVELKDYFSQGAATEVESVFLISKSNCAFVNYKTEAACLAALARFHDSRLRGARLVCRVRRGNTDLAGLSVTPPSLKDGDGVLVSSPGDEDGGGGRETNPTPGPHRYFIVKSLTVEDLEMSRQSGIWATQTHNEDHLNQAYETADHVYLIFSANKSGEYYGYARMMSPIKDDEVLARAMPPRPDHLFLEPDDLNVIATPATSTAPNGRIINDTARGTIFWEADTSEDEDEEEEEEEEEESQQAAPAEEWGGLQLIGKPFRIRWLSTERVPFHRTRGLRNPWNANREVKIARDGTELAPSVGEKLVLLFHPEEGGPGNAS